MRARYNQFVAKHEVAWELAMAGLAVMYVAVGFALDADDPATHGALFIVESSLTAIFASEFVTRFAASPDRRAYLRSHWIDLVALIPVVRGLRVFRLLRLLRLVRAFAGVYRALGHVEGLIRHRGLAGIFVAWLGVMLVTSAGFFIAEIGRNRLVNSPWDALWWGITTMTTVGYGELYPVTPEGRIAAGVLMLVGVGLFSVVTATVTSFLLVERRSDSAADRLRTISALHAEGLLTDDEYAERRSAAIRSL